MPSHSFFNKLVEFVGLENDAANHAEKWISGLGAVFGIYAIFLISPLFVSGPDIPLIVASMGASSVLLFATPHSKLGQPWNLCTGHLVSAFVGVCCARWIPDVGLASAVAVGGAITAMYYTRSIHPPGGATALMATIGGPSIHQLGFTYIFTPILVGALTLLAIAVLFNLLFQWRRYPVSLMRDEDKPVSATIQASDIQFALKKLGGYVDVTEAELEGLFTLAETHAQCDHLPTEAINVGHYYSNRKLGIQWSVRHIIDGPENSNNEDDRLVYKVVAGEALYEIGSATRLELSRWARHEVEQKDSGWKRIPATENI